MLRDALEGGETIVVTGLVLQELLQGFAGPRARKDIIDRFTALPLLTPDRQDHIEAAGLRNRCRRAGLQIGTIDAVIAQLCIRHQLKLLTTDNDFVLAAILRPARLEGGALAIGNSSRGGRTQWLSRFMYAPTVGNRPTPDGQRHRPSCPEVVKRPRGRSSAGR